MFNSYTIGNGVGVGGVAGMELKFGEQTEDVIYDSVLIDVVGYFCNCLEVVVGWGGVWYSLDVFYVDAAVEVYVEEAVIIAGELLYLVQSSLVEGRNALN